MTAGAGGASATYVHGGGGGAASFMGNGGGGNTSTATGSAAGPGAGGGGGYGRISDSRGTTHAGNSGGSAKAIIYFESETTEQYSTTAVTNRDSGSGPEITEPGGSSGGSSGGLSGGCVFPGTKIAITKDRNIDIVNFVSGNPIDFCNPDTLEHFQQQTLANCFYRKANKKITLTLEDGKSIALTANHAVLTPEGFKTFEPTINGFPLYTLGDKLATVDGYRKIDSIKNEPINETTVYNIITENSLMVANGIIISGELNMNIENIAVDPSVTPGGGDLNKDDNRP
jgi:hypothetical protein